MPICIVCSKDFEKKKDKRSSDRFCGIRCSASYYTKGRKHSGETKEKISNSLKGKTRKVKRKASLITKVCPVCENKFTLPEWAIKNRIFCSKICLISDEKNGFQFSKKPSGGQYNPGSGCGYSGWYKDIWCDSTYELVWVIYALDHNIKFLRNKEGFPYTYKNELHKYYPDFYLTETDEFIEIKGFQCNKDLEKWKQFPKKLTILFEKDIKHCFEYVSIKYSKDYNGLYDKPNKERRFKNVCPICGKPCYHKHCSLSHSQIDYHNRKRLAEAEGVEPS